MRTAEIRTWLVKAKPVPRREPLSDDASQAMWTPQVASCAGLDRTRPAGAWRFFSFTLLMRALRAGECRARPCCAAVAAIRFPCPRLHRLHATRRSYAIRQI